MLAFLDALCNALRQRDVAAITRLLEHPLASALPEAVLEEAGRIAAGTGKEYLAPVHTLRLYHQTAHLLGACADPATRRRPPLPARGVMEPTRQMELALEVPPTAAAVA